MSYLSPLLDLPSAVAGDGIDAPVAAHYGSFNGEQRTLEAGEGFVDLSHRGVVRISGPDRLTWLHSLTTQYFEGLQPGVADRCPDPQPAGPRRARDVRLRRRRGVHRPRRARRRGRARRVARPNALHDARRGRRRDRRLRRHLATGSRTADDSGARAVDLVGSLYAAYEFVPAPSSTTYAEAAGPACGMWAFEALRIARGEPRLGLDTDHRTIPNEVGWIGSAVHLDKGCYRGQETVARVHTLGKPPRRLTLLHLDGSANRLPTRESPLMLGEKSVGLRRLQRPPPRARPDRAGLVKRNVAARRRPSSSTASPPPRRSSSTPRSACTCAHNLGDSGRFCPRVPAAYVTFLMVSRRRSEPPRRVRRLQSLRRMGSCQEARRGGTRRSCRSGGPDGR